MGHWTLDTATATVSTITHRRGVILSQQFLSASWEETEEALGLAAILRLGTVRALLDLLYLPRGGSISMPTMWSQYQLPIRQGLFSGKVGCYDHTVGATNNRVGIDNCVSSLCCRHRGRGCVRA